MTIKKSFDQTGLSNKTRRSLSMASLESSIDAKGVQGDNLIEPLPTFNRSPSEKLIEGANNTSITFGRDRPGEVGSGYNNQTGAGTIDIVVGRMSADIQTSIMNEQSFSQEPLVTDNNLALDASRICISQKTDVDGNFNLADGTIGASKAKAAIAVKSDAVRLIGREGVKIITKVDGKNSQGAPILSVPRIDLIAGNDDSDQQPVVKGDDLGVVLKIIFDRIDELNSVLDSFMTAQTEYNNALMTHDHPSPIQMFLGALGASNPGAINGGNVVLSPAVLQAGIKAFSMQQIAKNDGVMHKLKVSSSRFNSTSPSGPNNPGSKGVKVS
jgi:hypothetical protein